MEVAQTLLQLATNLSEWKENTYAAVKKKKRELMARLAGIQRKQHSGSESKYLLKLEGKLQEELNLINYQEELIWFQRSRAKWLIDGDRNTKYYHIKATIRKRRNRIITLRNNHGEWEDDPNRVQNMIKSYYQQLFHEEARTYTYHQTSITYPPIDEADLQLLTSELSDDEIKNAVFKMAPWKAPGPDGFPAGFFQHTWEIVGTKVKEFANQVWNDPKSIAQVNYTDICLLPKVDHPEYVDQFRPISLCNSIYKVITKIVVERLKGIMDKIVSPFQSGFIPGRHIQDNIVVAQEMAHSMHKMKGKIGVFAIKVDLSKAYDKLRWNFINTVLEEVGLPAKLINIIMAAIQSVKTNILWNGVRSDFFQPSRGIRQGDPLSPYIFALSIDKLSHLITEKVNAGIWKGIKAGRNGPMVTHLMFADDLLLFGQASEEQMHCVLDTITDFCMMSGQQMNLEKTSIMYSRNVSDYVKRMINRLAGFREVTNLGKYLGVPLLGRAPKVADYQYILDKVNTKLAGWKTQQLSLAGRTTLAKSVIEAMPLYPMMVTPIPKSVLHDIQKKQRGFIWGDTDNHRKLHAVNWNIVTKPKNHGGLGLRNLVPMNQACLMKLGWHLKKHNNSLWCQVLHGKYDRTIGDTQFWQAKGYDSSLWKALTNIEPHIERHKYWSVGSGRQVKAWTQKWIDGETSISNLNVNIPPELLNCNVADLVLSNGNWNYAILSDWLPDEILSRIQAIPPPTDEDGEDICLWPGSVNGNFSISSAYHLLCNNYSGLTSNDTWAKIWKLGVKERVRYFIWILSHNRLLTNMRKAKFNLGTAYCFHCHSTEEDSLHVMRDCSHATHIWMHMINHKLQHQFFHGTLHDWIQLNLTSNVGKDSNMSWPEVWANTCHMLWGWRNKYTHELNYIMPREPWLLSQKESKDYKHYQQLQNVIQKSEKSVAYINWQKPMFGWIKVNSDGASNNQYELAGSGGILRDHNGIWQGGFSQSLGYCSAYIAELWGVYQGIKLAVAKGYQQIIVETDSQQIVSCLHNREMGISEGWRLMTKIHQEMQHSSCHFHFVHCYREANRVAHELAYIGCFQVSSVSYYDVPPNVIIEYIVSDCIGAATPRTVFG